MTNLPVPSRPTRTARPSPNGRAVLIHPSTPPSTPTSAIASPTLRTCRPNSVRVSIYVIGHDEITQTTYQYESGVVTGETTHTFHHDGHGSVRVLTDAAAAIAQAYTYSAYGELLAIHNAAAQLIATDASAALTSLLYSGEYFDAKIGQQYLRARWYDPSTGRFNRLDPFAGNMNDPQSSHRYLYCCASPIGHADPSGERLISTMVATVQAVSFDIPPLFSSRMHRQSRRRRPSRGRCG